MKHLDPPLIRETAINNFKSGYNCSQSIVLAFKDILDIDADTITKIASPFGGGMGRLRETCGAVTGMFLVLGLLYGYSTPEVRKKKQELYEKVQQLAKQFEEKHQSIVCRDILNIKVKHDVPTPSERTSEFYTARPCMFCIGDAAEILANFINEH